MKKGPGPLLKTSEQGDELDLPFQPKIIPVFGEKRSFVHLHGLGGQPGKRCRSQPNQGQRPACSLRRSSRLAAITSAELNFPFRIPRDAAKGFLGIGTRMIADPVSTKRIFVPIRGHFVETRCDIRLTSLLLALSLVVAPSVPAGASPEFSQGTLRPEVDKTGLESAFQKEDQRSQSSPQAGLEDLNDPETLKTLAASGSPEAIRPLIRSLSLNENHPDLRIEAIRGLGLLKEYNLPLEKAKEVPDTITGVITQVREELDIEREQIERAILPGSDNEIVVEIRFNQRSSPKEKMGRMAQRLDELYRAIVPIHSIKMAEDRIIAVFKMRRANLTQFWEAMGTHSFVADE